MILKTGRFDNIDSAVIISRVCKALDLTLLVLYMQLVNTADDDS